MKRGLLVARAGSDRGRSALVSDDLRVAIELIRSGSGCFSHGPWPRALEHTGTLDDCPDGSVEQRAAITATTLGPRAYSVPQEVPASPPKMYVLCTTYLPPANLTLSRLSLPSSALSSEAHYTVAPLLVLPVQSETLEQFKYREHPPRGRSKFLCLALFRSLLSLPRV